MARAFSQDLRDRVIDAGTGPSGGGPFRDRGGDGDRVGSSAQQGERSARKPGQPKRSKLDPHREYLMALIQAKPDITIAEMQERLRNETVSRLGRHGLDLLDRAA